MTIACLGWGSLIWNPDGLPIKAEWRIDGPALPVEFARKSGNGRMTLVIAEETDPIPVLWTVLDVASVDEARKVLGQREGITAGYVDRSVGTWSSSYSSEHSEGETIGKWAVAAGVTGVVWTALKPFFADRYIKPSCDQVIRYLASLEGEPRRLAEEYIRRAPAQIRTLYRDRIEHELGWTAA